MTTEDLHFELLRELTKEPSASQRRLGERMGISVGKVNYCLRAVIDKGWVKVNNFRRSDNKWAYTYLLTPSGAAEKVRLTHRFIERKEREFEDLLTEIQVLKSELSHESSPRPVSASLYNHCEAARKEAAATAPRPSCLL